MNQRYFRASEREYEEVRARLDEVFGFPSDRAETAVEPAATALRDGAGRLLVAVRDESCGPPADVVLAESLANGVEEITAEDYAAAMVFPEGF